MKINIKNDAKCKDMSFEANIYEYNLTSYGGDKKEVLEELLEEVEKAKIEIIKSEESIKKELKNINECKICGGSSYLTKRYYDELVVCPNCGGIK